MVYLLIMDSIIRYPKALSRSNNELPGIESNFVRNYFEIHNPAAVEQHPRPFINPLIVEPPQYDPIQRCMGGHYCGNPSLPTIHRS